MEITLLGAVATLGASFVVVATLALFALHAADTWWPRRAAVDTRRRSVDAVDFRLHHFPQNRQIEADDQDEEPARRAA